MSYRAIFFDWDGVITDSFDIKTKAFANLYQKYGTEVVQKVVDYHRQHGGISRFEKIRHFHKNFLRKDIDEAELTSLGEEFSNIVFDSVVRSDFIPGALETIRGEAAKGTMLFIVSGTPVDEIRKIAGAKHVSEYFTEIHGSPSTKTEIIMRMLNKYSLPPSKCLMIGDAMEDYSAACNSAVDFLGIATEAADFHVAFPAGTALRNRVQI